MELEGQGFVEVCGAFTETIKAVEFVVGIEHNFVIVFEGLEVIA